MVVVLLVLRSEDSDKQLSETQNDGSCPEQYVGVFLIKEAHRYDEEDGNCAGNGVEQIEFSDRNTMD
jgi:hypothetical protein